MSKHVKPKNSQVVQLVGSYMVPTSYYKQWELGTRYILAYIISVRNSILITIPKVGNPIAELRLAIENCARR